eukprot:6180658-Pleurochrysis_carterae.AAC.5
MPSRKLGICALPAAIAPVCHLNSLISALCPRPFQYAAVDFLAGGELQNRIWHCAYLNRSPRHQEGSPVPLFSSLQQRQASMYLCRRACKQHGSLGFGAGLAQLGRGCVAALVLPDCFLEQLSVAQPDCLQKLAALKAVDRDLRR